MSEELEIFKKKLLYRSAYRGTKEMDILLSSFVKKYINNLTDNQLKQLEIFLNFEDEIILDYYHNDIVKEKIDKNIISKMFKNFKL